MSWIYFSLSLTKKLITELLFHCVGCAYLSPHFSKKYIANLSCVYLSPCLDKTFMNGRILVWGEKFISELSCSCHHPSEVHQISIGGMTRLEWTFIKKYMIVGFWLSSAAFSFLPRSFSSPFSSLAIYFWNWYPALAVPYFTLIFLGNYWWHTLRCVKMESISLQKIYTLHLQKSIIKST